MMLTQLDDPSIVWVCEKIQPIMQRLCIQIKNIEDLQRVVIYTLDADSLAACMKQPDYAFVFEHPKLRICLFQPDENPSFEFVKEVFEPTHWDLTGQTCLLSNFPADSAYKEKWNKLIFGYHEVIDYMIGGGIGNHNVTADSLVGFRHSIQNLEAIFTRPDIRKLEGHYHSKPVIIIGAGPSINPQLEWLKKNQNKALLICADTMLRPLSEAEIYPDIVCSLERNEPIIDLLSVEQTKQKSLLLASSVLHPQCFKAFDGPYSIFFGPHPAYRWIPIPRSRLGTGHSCIGAAMALSGYLQADPIILMGLDLCWSIDGKSHMDNVSYLSEDFYKKSNTMLKNRAFTVENHKGDLVETNEYWTMFHHQFNRFTLDVPAKVYNLSDIGLKFDGAQYVDTHYIDKHVSLKDLNFDVHQDLMHHLEYDQPDTTHKQLDELIKRSQLSIQSNDQVIKKVKALAPENMLEHMENAPLWPLIYNPLLSPSLRDLNNPNHERRDKAKQASLDALEQLQELFELAGQEAKNLKDSHKRLY